MDEQEKQAQIEPEKTVGNTDIGEPSEAEEAIVKKAREAAEIIKTENEKKAELLTREEKLMERREAILKLGGGSVAGTRNVTPKETDVEYAKRAIAGELNKKDEETNN